MNTEVEGPDGIPPQKILSCSEPFIEIACVDGTKSEIAYGRGALPKLRREISHYSNPVKAGKALNALCDLLHDPEQAVEALRLNFTARFVSILTSEDVYLVQRTLMCIKIIANQPYGKVTILSNKYLVENIKKCICHPKSAIVRHQAAITVNALSQNGFVTRDLVDAGYIPYIMKCLLEVKDFRETTGHVEYNNLTEKKEILILHLKNAANLLCTDYGRILAIAMGAFHLSPLLGDEETPVRAAVSDFFTQLAKHPIGKEGACCHRLVHDICSQLLKTHEPEEVAKMVDLLQFGLIHNRARKECYSKDLIGYLVNLLGLHNVPIALKKAVINCLSNLAEMPQGRKELLSIFTKEPLEEKFSSLEMTKHEKDILLKAFLNVLNWTP